MELSGFREAIRTATVGYPIPFILATLLAFAVLCFGGALSASDAMRWILAGCGIFVMLSGVGIAIYATLFKEHLLRSERHSLTTRLIDALGDSDMDPASRNSLSTAIPDLLIEHKTKRDVSKQDHSGTSGRSSDDG
jgi:hypothetical protein